MSKIASHDNVVIYQSRNGALELKTDFGKETVWANLMQIANLFDTDMNDIKLFDNKKVRSVWSEEHQIWYFSIVDVISVLTDSINPIAYWRQLKERLKSEGNQTVTNCHALKMVAADGKMRITDVADTEQLFRLIQSIPSPKAEEKQIYK
jgi:hypothetical protein